MYAAVFSKGKGQGAHFHHHRVSEKPSGVGRSGPEGRQDYKSHKPESCQLQEGHRAHLSQEGWVREVSCHTAHIQAEAWYCPDPMQEESELGLGRG